MMKVVQPRDRQIRYCFIVLLMLGAGLRFFNLETNPNGLYCDEAINGYDAYSLAKTGRDMTGRKVPLLMNHFNLDHPESLYTYCCIPSIAVLGLSAGSLRLTSAILGTLSLYLLYLFVVSIRDEITGLIAVFFLAVSPVHLHFSRIGLRHITAPLIMILGFWLLNRSLKKPVLFPLAGLILGISANTYPPAKLSTPVLLVLFVGLHFTPFKNSVSRHRFHILAGLLCFMILFGIFISASTLMGDQVSNYSGKSVLIGSQPVHDFVQNILRYLGPETIWGPGDPNARHHVIGQGFLLKSTVPFLLIGCISGLLRRDRIVAFFLCWAVIGVVPAALTWEGVPHFGRAITMLPALEVLSACGVVSGLEMLRKWLPHSGVRWTAGMVVATVILINSVLYIRAELVLYPRDVTGEWEYGLKEAIHRAVQVSASQPVKLTPIINQAFIYAFFYGDQSPGDFHKTGKFSSVQVAPMDLEGEFRAYPGCVYVVRPDELIRAKIVDIVTDPHSRLSWKIVTGMKESGLVK
jgi:4-amino-4-deoxy-L-arabinose transferase-like glycosyltransferase